ncbi:hypothetical protein HPB50_011428 [Hyalomma asiaticum]|uniref:Uncharacterized protein n=1 Tax=Hyalomma asiaticum TaxID=266040 RepID=A0ACB7SGF8_HYAAI|nr:hypothetical protein HPB50_011428 [Hyalomma asiaticum]
MPLGSEKANSSCRQASVRPSDATILRRVFTRTAETPSDSERVAASAGRDAYLKTPAGAEGRNSTVPTTAASFGIAPAALARRRAVLERTFGSHGQVRRCSSWDVTLQGGRRCRRDGRRSCGGVRQWRRRGRGAPARLSLPRLLLSRLRSRRGHRGIPEEVCRSQGLPLCRRPGKGPACPRLAPPSRQQPRWRGSWQALCRSEKKSPRNSLGSRQAPARREGSEGTRDVVAGFQVALHSRVVPRTQPPSSAAIGVSSSSLTSSW